MNTDLMFSSNDNSWATPQNFFDELNKEFNFTLDPCATPETAKYKSPMKLRLFEKYNVTENKPWSGTFYFELQEGAEK